MADTFIITPASAKPMWLMGTVCLVVAIVLGALSYTAYASRHSSVQLDASALRIVGDFWGRTIPLAPIEAHRAKIIDLGSRPEFKPTRRTFGTGMPGYSSGWFKLANGEKALVYLTQGRQVVMCPPRRATCCCRASMRPSCFSLG